MRISLPTSPYNPRRDGKPWICKVIDWPTGASKPEIEWGSWYGRPGSAGELVIEAEPGDVLRHGQNDLRRSNHTYRQFVRVEADGSLVDLTDAEAARYCQGPKETANPLAAFSDADILAEARRRGLIA